MSAQTTTPTATGSASGAASHPLDDVVARHKSGEGGGVTAVCSAHPLVLAAAAQQAAADGTVLLVEATSNQVDQFGGYTGMRPADFRALVEGIADEHGLPRRQLVLGGDHLGPHRWRREAPEVAMRHAEDLVRAYAAAGFTKIHLDCTYPCAGEGALGDEVVAQRAARLAAVAEEVDAGAGRLRYVIGNEVPVPGGAEEAIEELAPTTPDAARRTLAAHREALAAVGLHRVWPQVVALVVQPGVEFDHLRVVDYDPSAAAELSTVLDEEPRMVFEAHSTDYQTPERLAALVRDHWAVLKVGPGLTFALREALFALAEVEVELVPAGSRSRLPQVLEEAMLAEPEQWAPYYDGDESARRLARRYSYSDRSRYYWPVPALRRAQEVLMGNLAGGVPLPVLSQHLPLQYDAVRAGTLGVSGSALAQDAVRRVLRQYAAACSPLSS